jgi:copper homeostasis protein (lipoprotein)
VRHHLDLWPDQVFHLRREWLGNGRVRGEVGRWRVDPARHALILEGGGEMPLQFAIEGPARLRQLGLSGQPIDSEQPHELSSDGQLDPADISLFMGGEVIHVADGLRFTECLTGRQYPVGAGGEAQRLEAEYLAKVRAPGAPLYVSFEGSIRHPAEGKRTRRDPTVTVERFVAAWPSQSCERSRADAALVNTYWRIVQLQGGPLTVVPGRREPHVLLRQTVEGSSYTATVGCNRLAGKFETSGETLSFGPATATRMACPPPLAELEGRLGEALELARRWQRTGNTLVLEDLQGRTLALLEAVYF